MNRDSRVLYLHGFASGPGSRKAVYLSEQLRAHGYSVEVPDLAEGNFEGLTISAQLRLLERLARNEPVILIGSSLGGYLAALYAARHPEVEKLVLLAPAFRFVELWSGELTPEQMNAWRKTGSLRIYHYRLGRDVNIGYQLLQDAEQFEPLPDFHQPALIVHGTKDASVPLGYSVEFAEVHANSRLMRVESGHELTDVLDLIWLAMEKFLLGDRVQI